MEALKAKDVVAMLVDVARKAYFLAEDTCDEGGIKTVPNSCFEDLSISLDALDDLPEPGPNLVGTGPAKAEAFLKNTRHLPASVTAVIEAAREESEIHTEKYGCCNCTLCYGIYELDKGRN